MSGTRIQESHSTQVHQLLVFSQELPKCRRGSAISLCRFLDSEHMHLRSGLLLHERLHQLLGILDELFHWDSLHRSLGWHGRSRCRGRGCSLLNSLPSLSSPLASCGCTPPSPTCATSRRRRRIACRDRLLLHLLLRRAGCSLVALCSTLVASISAFSLAKVLHGVLVLAGLSPPASFVCCIKPTWSRCSFRACSR